MDYLIAVYTGPKIFTLSLKPRGYATVGDSQGDKVMIEGSGLGSAYLELTCDGNGVRILAKKPMKFGTESVSQRVFSSGDIVTITDKITLAVFGGKCTEDSQISLEDFDELKIGRSYNKNDIALKDGEISSRHAILKRIDGHWEITDLGSKNGTFVNGSLVSANSPVPAENVNIFMAGYVFYIQNDTLIFTNTPGAVEFTPSVSDALLEGRRKPKRYPFFQRSPRIRVLPEKAEFEIQSPPNTGNKPQVSWVSMLLPPCMMVLVMGGVAIMMGNYTMLMYSLPMSLVSVVVNIVNYKNNMKKWLKNNGLAGEKYSQHLAGIEREINDAEGSYLSALSSMSPGVGECIALAENVSRLLWERTPRDNDFMAARVGTGQVPSNVSLRIPRSQLAIEENIFLRQAEEIRDKHTILSGVPVRHSFLDYPITGLAGKPEAVLNTASRIIMDLAAHHSYEDLKIICVYPEDERDKWEWLKWLPHVWDSERTKRYMACSQDEATKIFREASENLTKRRRDAKENSGGMDKEPVPMTPFYLMVIADSALLEASGEQFVPENDTLGFGVLYAYGDLGTLPLECQSVIMCDTPAEIQHTQRDSKSTRIPFTPDVVKASQLDAFARAMAPIRLVQTGKGSRMPKSVYFLQGFKVHKVNELDVMGRWDKNRWPRSLAAPIGIRENGDIFSFDMQDNSKSKQGMGPHGLSAGTSGSGKSEMLTTWLLSVALNYSPDDVNIVLIEFKGNDLSNILKPLPHVAGVVSNLDDPSAVIRCLRSLGGEILRRQKIFKEATEKTSLDTTHILDYQAHQKTHKELPALPYLIVVVDEYAQFATQFPDKAGMFTDIARIGRSLGVYMNLTMQAPQGLIKGQVKDNITFNICLRTATAEASKEIVGTTDAHEIKAPGRAIVKVAGNNPIYELVQTFYAKAPYNPNAEKKGPATEINIVELNGTRTRADNYDKTVKAKRDAQSEGRAVVSYIVDEAKADNVAWASHVWTEALPDLLTLDELTLGKRAFQDGAWTARNSGFSVTVGKVDDPENQSQYPFVMDFQNDGHQIIYGAPSSGKTTFIQTALISACLDYTPEQMNFMILDYGNWGAKFADLPHCLMIADPEDKEQRAKAEEYIVGELRNRKGLFSREGVGTLDAYAEVTGKSLPKVLVIVDNMASLNMQNPELMNPLIQAAREGGNYGVYLLLSSGSTGSFMYRISQYVKCNHTLQMTDKGDYRALVGGNGKVEPSRRAGRGLKRNSLEKDPLNPSDPPPPLEFQTALAVTGATEGERAKNLRELLASMTSTWTGRRASVKEAEETPIEAGELTASENGVQLGLSKKTRDPVEFVFADMNGCVISGSDGGGKTNILGFIVKTLNNDKNTKLYVYEEKSFLEALCPNAKTVHDAVGSDGVISEIAAEFDARIDDSAGRIVFCIDDFMTFYRGISNGSAKILETLTRDGADRGIYVYLACDAKSLAKLHTFKVKPFMNCLVNENAIFAGGTLGDYQAFKGMCRETEISLAEHEACMIHGKKAVVFRAAKV